MFQKQLEITRISNIPPKEIYGQLWFTTDKSIQAISLRTHPIHNIPCTTFSFLLRFFAFWPNFLSPLAVLGGSYQQNLLARSWNTIFLRGLVEADSQFFSRGIGNSLIYPLLPTDHAWWRYLSLAALVYLESLIQFLCTTAVGNHHECWWSEAPALPKKFEIYLEAVTGKR